MKTFAIRSLQLIVVLSLMIFTSCDSSAQLKSVGKRYSKSDQVSLDKIEHGIFNELLKKYVNSDGEVNYAGWKASTQDRRALQTYLNSLSRADTAMAAAHEAKLAYWINAYNAMTLEGILEVYPTTSIRNHTKKLGYDIWHDLKLQLGDTEINLNDIEHKVLRKMNEPRIHFAIVCASVGCPRLLNEAYTAEALERQLSSNTVDFFSRSRNLKFDAGRKQLQLSAILDWFGRDFGSSQTAQIRAIAPYFPADIKTIVRNGGYSVSYQDYDWNLNSQ